MQISMNCESENLNNAGYCSIDLEQSSNEFERTLQNKFNELNKGIKEKLYCSSEDFEYYSYYLNSNVNSTVSFIPRPVREFMLIVIIFLEDDKYLILRKILENPTYDGRYIHKNCKEMLVTIFQRWSKILLNTDTEVENKYYLKNGFFNPDFINLMRNMRIGQFLKSSGMDSFIVDVNGQVDEDSFYLKLSSYDPDCKVLVRYAQVERHDEFKFGDPYSECYVHDLSKSLPWPLQETIHFAGRGTAGCLIRVESGHVVRETLLTCAHVAFGGLSKTTSPDIIHQFNIFNVYSSYERGKIFNDYAILPCSVQFSSLDCVRFDTFVGKRICNSKYLVDFWKKLHLLRPQHNYYVYKRGIATDITKGIFGGYDMSDGTIIINQFEDKNFSDSGDSGSLVFLEDEEDDCLYPIALHFSRSGSVSFSIPLWRIFWSFCKKNNLDNVTLQFISPYLASSIQFMISDFDGCSVNGLVDSEATSIK